MKGIVLAGGGGSRLHPITQGVSKHLLAVYDKPMLYYPLSVLMLAGIRDLLVVTTPEDADNFHRLLGDGDAFGVRLSYATQPHPNGLAEAFVIGADFIGRDRVALVLGDNIFYGSYLSRVLRRAAKRRAGATIFSYYVHDPERFGVVEFDKRGAPTAIIEKPAKPKSNFAVTGLYFYDNAVVGIARGLKPSKRGELEISDINAEYLRRGKLRVERLGRGVAWLDTGTHESLLDAANFIRTIESRQGLQVACLQEIAWLNGWMTDEEVKDSVKGMARTEYGRYLLRRLEEGKEQ